MPLRQNLNGVRALRKVAHIGTGCAKTSRVPGFGRQSEPREMSELKERAEVTLKLSLAPSSTAAERGKRKCVQSEEERASDAESDRMWFCILPLFL
jgi:hypothetical protein